MLQNAVLRSAVCDVNTQKKQESPNMRG